MRPPEMDTLSVEVDDGIATLYLDRPEKLNAMNETMFRELGVAAVYIRDDPDIRVAIITGRGRAFSAGIDLGTAEMLAGTDITQFRALVRDIQRNFRAFELLEKPVIAMVNGHALGAGTQIALACDMILASTEATFGLLEVNIGLVTDLGASQMLPRYIGIHRAKELILTGKKINAAEADRIGLVNAVYPPDELLAETLALANHFKSLPALPIGLCKIAIDRSRDGSMESGLEYEALSQAICLGYMQGLAQRSKQEGGDT